MCIRDRMWGIPLDFNMFAVCGICALISMWLGEMCIRDRNRGSRRSSGTDNFPAYRPVPQKKGKLNYDLSPVSYTHLDVYKRQGQTASCWM